MKQQDEFKPRNVDTFNQRVPVAPDMVTSVHALIECIQIGQSKPAEVHALEQGHQPAQKVQDTLFVEGSLPQHRQAGQSYEQQQLCKASR